MITQETIERFFSNNCTSQETAEVKAYFEINPDAMSGLEQEWNEFQLLGNLPASVSKKLWAEIQRETNPVPVLSIYLKRIAVAVSVVLMLGAAWYFIIHKTYNPKNNIVQVKNKLKTIVNTTTDKLTVRFSDSSLAELMPNSSVTFAEQFDSLKREVTLKGEAWFAVTKDPARPFAVTSGSIITTVLGTKFTIKSYDYDGQIKVTLHEGKVKITVNGAAFNGSKNVYYLYPEDVFVCNKKTSEAVLQSHAANDAETKNTVTDKNKANAVMQSDNWYMFNNQPLCEVLDQLEILYSTKIGYKKADVKGLTFIGKLDKSNSLETILNSIALLNNLHLTKQGAAYLLSK